MSKKDIHTVGKKSSYASVPNPPRNVSKGRGAIHRNEKTGAFTGEKSVRSIRHNAGKYAEVLKRLATK